MIIVYKKYLGKYYCSFEIFDQNQKLVVTEPLQRRKREMEIENATFHLH